MKIFLTGGTGLIGSHVADQLRRRGDAVVALVRGTSDTAHLKALGCELVEGDVLDPPEAHARRMEGADAVVHAAAMVFHRASRAEFIRWNVDGTEAVLGGAARTAPRVIHVSSVAVYAGLGAGPGLPEARWTEADPERQHAYAASKHLSEGVAWRYHDEGRIRLSTVRPSVVYGERDRAATPIIMRYSRLPLVPLLGGGSARLPLVYAANVATGILSALDRASTAGRAYNLALDQPLSLRELLEQVAAARGRRARFVHIPGAPVLGMATALEWLTRVLPFVPRADLRRAVRSMVRDNPYDSSLARLELGWAGLIPHSEGIRRTVEWWRARERRTT